MAFWAQAASEYAAVASGSHGTAQRDTGIEVVGRILSTAAAIWEIASTFAVEHPVPTIVGTLLLGFLMERLLARRSWRF